MNTVKYFVDDQGVYIGAFEGALPPVGAIEVATPPNHGLDIWNGTSWDAAIKTLQESAAELNHLYDAAMLTLQNGYSNEEVKTFAVKQDAIHEYVSGGIAGLSAENRSMIEALTGSTNDLVLAAKLDNMVAASATFKNYLALIERARDIHILQLVDGVDNSVVVASLAAAYAALGG
tara:strand:+ start:465 stop:992 length:528 start_codon:yes stop_codon:yes gene_type:complete